MTTIDLANLGTAGVKFFGQAADDGLGFRATGPAGDVNGDGIDDLLFAAFTANGRAGRVYVVFGTRDGLPTDLGNLGTGGFTVTGAAGEFLGNDASGIGDINGDGIDDLAASAFAGGDGRIVVVFGGSGLSSDVVVDSIGAGGIVITGIPGDSAYQIAPGGDFNGDGIADLVIGAASNDAGGNDAGAAFVIFGNDQGLPATIDLATLGPSGLAITGTTGQRAGSYVGGGGDVNGDGFDDVVLSIFGNAAQVVFGVLGGTADIALAGGGFSITGLASVRGTVAVARDVNGDGIDDILLGDPFAGGGAGSVHVVFGRGIFGRVTPADVDVTTLGNTGIRIDGSVAENVGLAVAGAQGDVNGDGYNDIVIGARFSTNAYIVFGGPNLPSTIDLANLGDAQGIVIADDTTANALGLSISGAGDVNGDGLADIRVGARSDYDVGFAAGAEYLIYGVFNATATAGDDNFTSGSLDDSIAGGDGNDSLRSNAGNDTLAGDNGNDTLEGGSGSDSLMGGANDDSLVGGDGADELFGDAGNDVLIGGADDGNDTVSGGDGDDTGYGQAGDDSLMGGAGGDILRGNLGDDSLTGGAGGDILNGQVGNDVIDGGVDADLLFGGGGDDSLDGGTGVDIVNGNSGADTVNGGDGDDALRGQGGNDVINGDAGNDLVRGISGLDSLFGGAGDDSLTGGVGNDQLTGGDGADVFEFAALQGADIITDFEDGIDRMSFVGVSAFGDLAIVDGDSGAEITLASEGDTPTLRVTLTNITAAQLTANDFIFG